MAKPMMNDTVISHIEFLSSKGCVGRTTNCRLIYYTSGCVKFVSYNTVVAFRNATGVWHLADFAYSISRSTSKHLCWLRYHVLDKVRPVVILSSLSEDDFKKYAIISGIPL